MIFALYVNKILEVINNKKLIKNNQKSTKNLCGWEDAHFWIKIGSILDLSLNKKSHKNMHSQIYSGLSLMWIFHNFPNKISAKWRDNLKKKKKTHTQLNIELNHNLFI